MNLPVPRRASFFVAVLAIPFGCRQPEPDPAPPSPEPNADAPAVARATPDPPPTDDAVHGELTEVAGQRVLRLWGTPRQMGFAHGKLLRDGITEIVEGYALGVIRREVLESAAGVYDAVADIPAPLREEAEGIVEGMRAAGGARIESLDRDLTARDLLVLNAMTDLLSIGCSSVSAWGAATAGDPSLAGAPAIVRNLDWSDDEELLRNQIVIAYAPTDPARQEVVSVAFAGYIGCLSCMNEAGVTALFNMGYGEGAADLGSALAGFAPANLLLRDLMSRRDVDGDGRTSADDIEAGVREATHAGSWILHVVEPSDAQRARAPARVLEVEADGVVRRDPDDTLGPEMLAATNHLRAKDSPRPGARWRTIERRTATRATDREALWSLGAEIRLDAVVHSVLAEPDAHRISVWLRRPGDPPHTATAPVAHEWPALFR